MAGRMRGVQGSRASRPAHHRIRYGMVGGVGRFSVRRAH